MTNAPNSMDIIFKAADYATLQSDRWMFILVLFILLSASAWLVRSLSNRLQTMTDLHIGQIERMATLMGNNTAALNEVSKKLFDITALHSEQTASLVLLVNSNTLALQEVGKQVVLCKYVQQGGGHASGPFTRPHESPP